MSVHAKFSSSKRIYTLNVDGYFDEEAAENAYNLIADFHGNFDYVVFDFKDCEYIDALVLGPLCELCDRVKSLNADIYCTNMNDAVLENFRMLNLHKIFKPEYIRGNVRVSWIYRH